MSKYSNLPLALNRRGSDVPVEPANAVTNTVGVEDRRRQKRRLSVLVVGQVPPPFHGQAVMIERLLESPLDDVQLYHVRMSFARSIDDLGAVRIGKLFHLLGVILHIMYVRLRHGVTLLYYPPSGPNVVPILKDIAILGCTRWMFRQTVFHIHAGGSAAVYEQLNGWQKWLFRRTMYSPDAVIRISDKTPEDGRGLRANCEFIVPNGIVDACGARGGPCEKAVAKKGSHHDSLGDAERDKAERDRKGLCLLYVGALNESKGVLDLVRACRHLKDRRVPFQLTLVGQCASDSFRRQLDNEIHEAGIADRVELAGVLTGDAKFDRFAEADVFCFPSFYECEAFPLVLLEALSFGLPVIATRWRGIPSIIEDGESGILIEPHRADDLASRIEQLYASEALREKLSRQARRRFLAEYTGDIFAKRMEYVFLATASADGGCR